MNNFFKNNPVFCLLFLFNSRIKQNKKYPDKSYIEIRWNKDPKSEYFNKESFNSEFIEYCSKNINFIGFDFSYDSDILLKLHFKFNSYDEIRKEYENLINLACDSAESFYLENKNKRNFLEDLITCIQAPRGTRQPTFLVNMLFSEGLFGRLYFKDFLWNKIVNLSLNLGYDFNEYFYCTKVKHKTFKEIVYQVKINFKNIKKNVNTFTKSKFSDGNILVKKGFQKINANNQAANISNENDIKNLDEIIPINEEDIYQLFKVKKRDTKAIMQMKEKYFKVIGYECELCGFSFKENAGINYIEMHHIIGRNEKSIKRNYNVSNTNIDELKEDFMFLCSNCHTIMDRFEKIDTKSKFSQNYFSKKIIKSPSIISDNFFNKKEN